MRYAQGQREYCTSDWHRFQCDAAVSVSAANLPAVAESTRRFVQRIQTWLVMCRCDIWVIHSQSGHGRRLTFAHDDQKPFADDPLSAGLPSYVMQEEFSRYEGFWWQPYTEDGDDVFRIVDESEIGLFAFPSSLSIGDEYEEYRFPRAGSRAQSPRLRLV